MKIFSESFLNKINALPKPISDFCFALIFIHYGWVQFFDSFESWKTIMVTDYNTSSKKYCGLTWFDQFYMKL